jgi:hypothetical protein
LLLAVVVVDRLLSEGKLTFNLSVLVFRREKSPPTNPPAPQDGSIMAGALRVLQSIMLNSTSSSSSSG